MEEAELFGVICKCGYISYGYPTYRAAEDASIRHDKAHIRHRRGLRPDREDEPRIDDDVYGVGRAGQPSVQPPILPGDGDHDQRKGYIAADDPERRRGKVDDRARVDDHRKKEER